MSANNALSPSESKGVTSNSSVTSSDLDTSKIRNFWLQKERSATSVAHAIATASLSPAHTNTSSASEHAPNPATSPRHHLTSPTNSNPSTPITKSVSASHSSPDSNPISANSTPNKLVPSLSASSVKDRKALFDNKFNTIAVKVSDRKTFFEKFTSADDAPAAKPIPRVGSGVQGEAAAEAERERVRKLALDFERRAQEKIKKQMQLERQNRDKIMNMFGGANNNNSAKDRDKTREMTDSQSAPVAADAVNGNQPKEPSKEAPPTNLSSSTPLPPQQKVLPKSASETKLSARMSAEIRPEEAPKAPVIVTPTEKSQEKKDFEAELSRKLSKPRRHGEEKEQVAGVETPAGDTNAGQAAEETAAEVSVKRKEKSRRRRRRKSDSKVEQQTDEKVSAEERERIKREYNSAIESPVSVSGSPQKIIQEESDDPVKRRSWFMKYQNNRNTLDQQAQLRRKFRADSGDFGDTAAELTIGRKEHVRRSSVGGENLALSRSKSASSDGSKHDSDSFSPVEAAASQMEISSITEANVRKYEEEKTPRNKVLRELIETEKDYIVDLEVIGNVFLKPIRQKKLMNAKEIEDVFSNVDMLFNIHKELVKKFDVPVLDDLMFGQAFLRVVDFLKIYAQYCASQSKAMTTLKKLREHSSDMESFLKNALSNAECRNQSLESFLIKPVQRICKYPLLLRELLKHTPPEHPDYEPISKSMSSIESIVTQINETKRIKDNTFKLGEIAEQLEDSQDLKIVDPNRWLLKEGEMFLIKKNKIAKGYSFLFNDVFLHTKLKKGTSRGRKTMTMRIMVPLFGCSVQATEIPNFENVFQLFSITEKKKYIFSSSNPALRKEWIEVINKAIENNMTATSEAEGSVVDDTHNIVL
eukprot:TRINITY_DN7982_c0_g1_i1.p1 TRINITY_DN7982_c0_g1~~TRINITY_DN7982_c0_g1_i1.p1  ORF type:complete len:872 (-),score=270.52 TRINITY_DN7982_c0_g1_i1:25-2640(-)